MAFEPRKFIHCLLLLCISLMFIFISMVIYQHFASVSSYWSLHQKVSGKLEFCFREKTKDSGLVSRYQSRGDELVLTHAIGASRRPVVLESGCSPPSPLPIVPLFFLFFFLTGSVVGHHI